jgi:hypothetical protein
MCGAMDADPFEQPYWNLDQYLIWLASRDPAAVLNATDRPNSGANPPIGWRMHRESNVDRQKVEMEAVRAIKCGYTTSRRTRKRYATVSAACCVEFNGEWFTRNPEWFADCVIEFEGEPTFAALLVRTREHGRREKVRPRFNPQSIARLYPAPTPSDIRDRPDVENPDVGPFIAYYDAFYWLAERISRREPLPIDEAGSRAEKTIRSICMTTPEKLTMRGFRKGDPDAELKPITPEAWQGLLINPLYGQPETDLKAVGYRREYGAPTNGEYGPVIWTGLCFDRKQFVAAFVTGGGNGPPTHTPAARPTQPAGRRGTAPKADWSAIEEAFRREVAERGMPDETNVDGWQRQADVERWLSDILIRERVEVSEATLRRRAKDFLSRARGGS